MVHISNLVFAYGKKNSLFQGLDLDLEAGNIYGLLGKNGAGKTTLLKILAGALRIKTGECVVMGEKPEYRTPQFLRELFFIPEDFAVPPIRSNLYIKLYAPFYPRFDKEKFNEFEREFQIPEKVPLNTLSYGQRKKFLIAFALATNCRLLLLDEPTNGLDIPSKSQFRKLVASSLTEDRSFIISTHQVRDLETLIDPIVILDEGKVIFNYPMSAVAGKLSVSLSREEPSPGQAVYIEKVLGGYTVLEPNTGEYETNIDLELLFNAVVGNREKMKELMERKD